MEDTVEKINLNHLNKSNWETYRFEEIARKISETVDPNTTTLQTYVGLEHIDPEDIHIRRFGSPDDVSGGKLKCYPGDVIFGKRRAYQRKAAIVDFEGICSAHAFVFRANPDVIDPQLFPFFLHSDQFMHRMVDISVGGLSPTINWGDLKHQEFLLPPKAEQARLAELLWAMDEVIESEREVLERLKITSQVFFENEVKKSKGKYMPLKKVLIPKKGKSQIPHSIKKYIGLEHIESGSFRCTQFGDSAEVLAQCNVIEEGDLCYSKLRPYLDKAFIAEFKAVSTTELLVYDTKLASKEFVLHYFHSRPFIQFVSGKGFGTKMPRVSDKIIGEFQIKILEDENPILDKMRDFQNNENNIKLKISNSKSLQKSLINQIF